MGFRSSQPLLLVICTDNVLFLLLCFILLGSGPPIGSTGPPSTSSIILDLWGGGADNMSPSIIEGHYLVAWSLPVEIGLLPQQPAESPAHHPLPHFLEEVLRGRRGRERRGEKPDAWGQPNQPTSCLSGASKHSSCASLPLRVVGCSRPHREPFTRQPVGVLTVTDSSFHR